MPSGGSSDPSVIPAKAGPALGPRFRVAFAEDKKQFGAEYSAELRTHCASTRRREGGAGRFARCHHAVKTSTGV